MGCGCNKKSGICVICHRSSNEMHPWGKSQQICGACARAKTKEITVRENKKAQSLEDKEYIKKNKILISGKDYD